MFFGLIEKLSDEFQLDLMNLFTRKFQQSIEKRRTKTRHKIL